MDLNTSKPATQCRAWVVVFALWWFFASCCERTRLVLGQTLPPIADQSLPPAAGQSLPPVAYPPGVVSQFPPGTPNDVINAFLYQQIEQMTGNITTRLQSTFSYCITNGEREKDEVFGFQSDSPFLGQCFEATGGTMSDRICGQAEIKEYFSNLANVDTPPPNDNCNASSWPRACESGWTGTVAPGTSAPSTFINGTSINSTVIPERLHEPLPCCAGFFCPRGLTCMLPCPLGSYCPLATLNTATGLCDPYGYQLTQGRDNQCGGADKWADVGQSSSIFCPAGLYCPTTILSIDCSSGHYCRLGSTAQDACTYLTSCSDDNLQKENLTGVGGLIIVVLTMILLLLFTCSDWVMDIRKRRKSKARDLAQRQAVEQISGLERWRQAKESAKRGATSFTRKLSKGVSRKSSTNVRAGSEDYYGGTVTDYFRGGYTPGLPVETIDEEDSSTNGSTIRPPLSPIPLVDFSDVTDLYAPVSVPPVEYIPDPLPSEEPSIRGSKEGSLKGKRPPSLTTPLRESQSQIFAYAYGQIEKEKLFGLQSSTEALFSTQTGGGEYHLGQVVGKTRPPVELSFIDLSLFLKGSGKKILSNVTGKLSPGRITAVMGPSGAGKTTFLNALAGKSTHSRMTGAVFINGKPDSIQCYKSIIGFVPQDDIVHGNLTVEENLWFSASYRLPVDMPKCDRVLVVERIIAALGLGAIRDSQVGTVERRGISGGQRKRVNVGLEMVMEPSLLILDEPTSGLDSTSSRLVLQALRREANVGVNVGVVLHQPSYGLFKMFDDVMFLAKGGRTVYLGPVNEVEDYFSSLGLMVPDRINPPDHYMDALEGIVLPTNQKDFDPNNLPVMWMIHKGFNIPPELMATAADLQSGGTGTRRDAAAKKEPKGKTTFIQDFLIEVKVFVEVRKEMITGSFARVENKSGRKTPGFWPQFRTIIRRVGKQRFREARIQFQDYIILLMAGACVGVLSQMKDTNLGSSGYFYTLIALALLIMIATLRTFSNDKLTFWRESASGINRVAYFLAKDVVDLFNVVLKPVIYLSMFYFFSNPRSTFADNFTVTVVFVYCVTGIAYICAILLQPAPAQLWSVFLPILATLIVAAKRTGVLLYLTYISYARWANEAFVVANAGRYKGVWIITRCAILQNLGYELSNWSVCLVILVAYGLVARGIALLCLFMSNRNRQK